MTHRTRDNHIAKVLARVERALIVKTLRRNDGNVSRTARELGVDRADFYKRMRKVGLQPNSRKREGNAAWQALGDYTE